MTKYIISPLDTLFFRDGRPFNMGETGQMKVEGVFPPYPTTIVGSMRYALAINHGWSPDSAQSDWTTGAKGADFNNVLGSGTTLGNAEFSGPYLLHRKNANADLKPLFPAPAHLLAKKRQDAEGFEDIRRLGKSQTQYFTDIGEKYLPVPIKINESEIPKGIKPLEGYWLTSDGIKAILEGGLPLEKDIIPQSILWETEDRVGVQRNSKTHATEDDALYQIQHIRLNQNTSLAMEIKNLPSGWQPQSLTSLGGESRLVWVDQATTDWKLPEAEKNKFAALANTDIFRYTITLITAADFFAKDETNHEKSIEDIVTGLSNSSRLITACVYKPKLVGGWDSRKTEPLPLKPLITAGSTWLLEANIDDKDIILAKNGSHIGKRTNWGFGQILIGIWK